jgi:hypothetical protein
MAEKPRPPEEDEVIKTPDWVIEAKRQEEDDRKKGFISKSEHDTKEILRKQREQAEGEEPMTSAEWEEAESLYYDEQEKQAMRGKVAEKRGYHPPPPPRLSKAKQELVDRFLEERQELIKEAEVILAEEKAIKDAYDEYIKSQGGERVTVGHDGGYRDYIKIDGHTTEAPPPPPRSKKTEELLQKYYEVSGRQKRSENKIRFMNPDAPKPPPPPARKKK